MKEKAPASVGSTDQGVIRTAEAARVLNSSMWLQAANRKEILSDVPQLQNRSREGWTALGTALNDSSVSSAEGVLRTHRKRYSARIPAFPKPRS